MTVSAAESLSDDALWAGLQEHVHATLGIVGIPKMLAARSEEAAKAKWVARARGVLDKLSARVPLIAAGPGRFAVGDGVELQLDIHTAIVVVDGAPRITTMIAFDPAALILTTVGSRRWGGRWTSSLAGQETSRPIMERDDPGVDATEFPWVAQNPGHPGPWTSAATAEEARGAATAEDIGFERLSSLFGEFQEASHE